jgi:hypothetical protein
MLEDHVRMGAAAESHYSNLHGYVTRLESQAREELSA